MEQEGVKIYGGSKRISKDPIKISSSEPPPADPKKDVVKGTDHATVVKKDNEGNIIAED